MQKSGLLDRAAAGETLFLAVMIVIVIMVVVAVLTIGGRGNVRNLLGNRMLPADRGDADI